MNLRLFRLLSGMLSAALAMATSSLPAAVPENIVDNADSGLMTLTGAWTASSAQPGFNGTDYLHNGNTGQGTKQVFFSVPPGVAGSQAVYLRWVENPNRATNVPVEIVHSGGIASLTINQRADGSQWNLLGIHNFTGAAGEGLVIKTTGTNGYVVADAVGFSSHGGDGTDTDSDGLTDVQEILLGLNPEVSDAAFISAVKAHPDYFGLYGTAIPSESEIQDLFVTRPLLSANGAPFLDFDISLIAPDRSPVEDFSLSIDKNTDRSFFRVSLQSEPAKLVTRLGNGQATKVVLYGTSLTAGYLWGSELESWLTAAYPGLVTVINSGMSGKDSIEGVAQLQSKVLDHNPDVVFIEFAMNDAGNYPDGTVKLPVEGAQANLAYMIDNIQAQNPDVEIILQTMNMPWDSSYGSGISAAIRPNLAAYYQMYRDVAAARGLMIIDHQPNWVALQQNHPLTYQLYVSDGVHPVADGLRDVMIPLLKWKLTGGQPLP